MTPEEDFWGFLIWFLYVACPCIEVSSSLKVKSAGHRTSFEMVCLINCHEFGDAEDQLAWSLRIVRVT